VRRQSEAAAALWIGFIEIYCWVIQSGVALRLPPHSKGAAFVKTGFFKVCQ
jgi:hypothetical protein